MASVTTSLHASVAAGPGWLAGGWLLQNSSASTYNSTREVSGSTAGLPSRKAGTATPPYSSESSPFNSHQALKHPSACFGKPRRTGLALMDLGSRHGCVLQPRSFADTLVDTHGGLSRSSSDW